MIEIRRPFTRYACWRMCETMVSQLNSRSGKTFGSGSKTTIVPWRPEAPIFFTFETGLPPSLYSCAYFPPSRCTSARTETESALTTETPTPCKPPETLYPSPPNFPPAWSFVITVSSAETFVFGWMSTGIPRPLSATRTRLPGRSAISMSFANPPIASSRELSNTSQTRWCRPALPVVPMYMPGRRRTASSPSRTVMSLAPYDPAERVCPILGAISLTFFALVLAIVRLFSVAKKGPVG
ncbi:MAG: hypothetical protein UY98_C0001G0023 [Candidatus Kaiserbacteria bacterium GW2011_GWA2_58_9]|uniref:Uncharacterized protein n=1 Tax=Candidatus Kaiserbacteria bacterium GW2011_GWA2_58_9 TaxID=1618672 RepID=A0A0G1YXG9_9BACT|nr:MAG: hypothetical protein UY98_C0001G0023 [Candidatus Kaiserbacteria bacterium GW2011_GWA2_58_9]